MEKQLITGIRVNNITTDVIMKHTTIAELDEHGKKICVNEKECIFKMQGAAKSFTFYIQEPNGNGFVQVEIQASSIKKMHDSMLEVEKIRTEEFLD